MSRFLRKHYCLLSYHGILPLRFRSDPRSAGKHLLMLCISSAILLLGPAHGAYAHGGGFHHGGMGSGQFHPGHIGGGQFHPGHIGSGHFHPDHFHHHQHGAVVFVAPFLGYYPPPVYYPQTIVTQGGPMTFIEQGTDGATYSYWYYCADPPGYYPQIQQCSSVWESVLATPSY